MLLSYRSYFFRIKIEVVEVSSKFASSSAANKLKYCDRKLAIIVGHKFSSLVHQSPVQVKVPSGKYQCHLHYESALPKLSSEDFKSIIKFQTSAIPAVLESAVRWTCVVPEAAEFLIVVIDEFSRIDFELMAKASQQPTSGLGGSNEFEVSALVFLANGKSCLLILVCLTTCILLLK